MSKLFKRKSVLIPSASLCILAIIAALSTSTISTEKDANEPALKAETVNVNVLKTQIKQPLAITDDSDINKKEEDNDKVYDPSMVDVLEDDSIEINGGELLEEGGAYIPQP